MAFPVFLQKGCVPCLTLPASPEQEGVTQTSALHAAGLNAGNFSPSQFAILSLDAITLPLGVSLPHMRPHQ